MIERLTPSHRGEERYSVTLNLKDLGSGYDVVARRATYKIRPERVVAIWERDHSFGRFTQWKRKVLIPFHGASRIVGPRVLLHGVSHSHENYVELFAADGVGGPLTTFARSIPGLAEEIAEIEAQLP